MITWQAEIAALRRAIVTIIDRRINGLFGWTLTSNASAMGDSDQVQTGDEPVDGKQTQRPVRRIEQFGLRSRPPAKIRSLWLRLGSSNVLFLGIAPTKGYGPTDLADGETAVYSKAVEKGMHLDTDGNNNINAASSKDVVVNGGTKKVARVDDLVIAGTSMAAWISAISAKFNAVAAPMVSAPGSITPPVTFGKISTGADHFKA